MTSGDVQEWTTAITNLVAAVGVVVLLVLRAFDRGKAKEQGLKLDDQADQLDDQAVKLDAMHAKIEDVHDRVVRTPGGDTADPGPVDVRVVNTPDDRVPVSEATGLKADNADRGR